MSDRAVVRFPRAPSADDTDAGQVLVTSDPPALVVGLRLLDAALLRLAVAWLVWRLW